MNSQENPEDILTVAQAAKLLGCSAQSLRTWDRAGIIKPSYRTLVGKHRRYYRKDVQALIDKRDHNEEAPLAIAQPDPVVHHPV
jgi:excisionase family DNA binding protein